ncbi:MAG: hypothetical protein GXY83_14830, partial [Rhodopirellula sp.]|nr:hypothetical protein [Rhodopirellula sp.]
METAPQPRTFAGLSVAAHSSLDDLIAALAATDPCVRLLPARVLRRVIRHQYQLPRLRIQIPHDGSCLIRREVLLEIVDEVELAEVDAALPENLILFALPEPEELQAMSPGSLLARYWRLLFHSRVHVRLEEGRTSGHITATDLRGWLEQIGTARFSEVRSILLREGLLHEDADHWTTLVEFAATWLELKYFCPGTLASFFPQLDEDGSVDTMLAEVLDADQLYA